MALGNEHTMNEQSGSPTPQELQSSLTDTTWMEQFTSFNNGTPCFQDLTSTSDDFEPLISTNEQLMESLSDKGDTLYATKYLANNLMVQNSINSVNSVICPTNSSQFVPRLDNTGDDCCAGKSMYSLVIPVPVEEAERPPSLLLAQDTCDPVKGEGRQRSPSPPSFLKLHLNSDVALSTECVVTARPEVSGNIKARLSKKIKNKRKREGMDEVICTSKKQVKYEMTPIDDEKYERRKASNRKASAKQRMKKKDQEAELATEASEITDANEGMKKDIQQLKNDIKKLQDDVEYHKRQCSWNPDLEA